ncbi:carboxypeptidase-like regulatory domain-containing protein [Fulvivirgaceae bacterium PWU20]|uniref:Carboxypeptidase-like regulatory domain-containing protein n=2 Tax=Chryseosolibacter indicus TaxID=2782351 RepID=A0ABS5VY41_9BACT|nr:TonB-dependent receptor [Chryseosolibacter indicus]MBT1705983.1 carboxypeptidase-like regulatory domain-containing protein [Chryseosolibacter indicus]
MSANIAFAHGNLIKGTVTDSLTAERLTGASVILNNESITSTDQFGNFRFDGLEDGNYTIKISFIGYKAYTTTLTVNGEETKTLIIKLTPSTLRLDEVTITGAYSTEHTMTSINKIDIGLRPLKSSQDVLRMIPGVVTAQHAGGGKAEQIFLRGFDIDHGTDIILTVDGMPVNMVSHAHGQGYADLHFVTPELIDYVDFNKGPYYSRVGDFNTAGYANFHTKNSIDRSSVKFEAGRFDTYRTVAMLDLLGKNDRNQNAYVSAEYYYTNGPFESPQNFNRLNLFGKFNGLIADDKILSVSLSAFKSEWDASGQISERAVTSGLISRFGAIDNTEGGFTGRNNVNVSLTKVFEDGSRFKNQVYFSHYNFELYSNFTYFLNDSINGDAIKQKESRDIYGYMGTYQKELLIGGKPLRFESGVGIRYDDISNIELSHIKARYTFLNAIALGDVDQINANVYTDAMLNLTQKLSLNAGLRVDAFSFQHSNKLDSLYNRQSQSKTAISPKLNVYYNINPDFQIYFKNGIGFHSNDTRVVVSQRGHEILPKAYGTDLGVFAKPLRNLLLNAALWQLKLDQEFVYVGDEAVVEPSGKTQRYGIDLSLRYQAADWLFIDFDGNYSHGRSIDDPEGENYIPLAPTFTSIGGITTSLKNGLRASLRYRHVDNRPANEDNSVTAKGYFLLDAALTYTRPAYEISLNASNLLNREWNEAQFDTETRLPGERQGLSELAFTPGDPFFIKAGVSFFF